MYLSHHKSHHLSFCSLYVIWSKPHIFHKFIYGVSLSSIPFSLSITFALWAHQLVLLAQSLFLQHRHSVSLDSLVWTKSHYPLQKLLHCLLNIGLLFFPPKCSISRERIPSSPSLTLPGSHTFFSYKIFGPYATATFFTPSFTLIHLRWPTVPICLGLWGVPRTRDFHL